MTDDYGAPERGGAARRAGLGLKIGLVAAGVAAGALGATAIAASASTDTTSGTASTAASASTAPTGVPGAPGTGRDHRGGLGGAQPVRDDEKAVSAALAAKLKAAALKAVPGGTVVRVETDAGDATYKAHMTKADGSPVTVKFDKNLKATAVEDGMGKGDPAPPR